MASIYSQSRMDSVWIVEHLTDQVVQKNTMVPRSILIRLQRTVKARKTIGAYFRAIYNDEQEEANLNRSYFPDTMQNV